MKKENIYTDEELYWMTGGDAGTLPTRIITSVRDNRVSYTI